LAGGDLTGAGLRRSWLPRSRTLHSLLTAVGAFPYKVFSVLCSVNYAPTQAFAERAATAHQACVTELSCTSPEILDAAERSGWQRQAGAVRQVSWGGDCYAYGLLVLGQIALIAEGDMKLGTGPRWCR
jgi:hypothetical protein